ncbi:wax ester/triacylglycerol synthase domain-containing protein [Mycobacterium tuberculosis]
MVSELHAGMLDRSRPLWQVDLIEGLPGGRCAITSVHHALADGVSVMRLTTDRHRGPASASDAHLVEVPAQASVAKHTAPRGSSRPLTLAKGVLGQARGRPAWCVVADNHVAGSAMSQRAADTGRTTHPAERADRRARSVAGCSFPIERLRQVAEHADATINDVVLAMCGGALRAYLISRGSVTGCAAGDGAGFAARYPQLSTCSARVQATRSVR